jgi:hypothetical protein
VIISGAVTDLCRRREGALQSSPVCWADSRGWLDISAELDARTLPEALTSCCPRGLLRPSAAMRSRRRAAHGPSRCRQPVPRLPVSRIDTYGEVASATTGWAFLSSHASSRSPTDRRPEESHTHAGQEQTRHPVRPMPVISRSSSAGGQVAADFRQPATAAPAQAAG